MTFDAFAHAAKVAVKRTPLGPLLRGALSPPRLMPAIKIARRRGWDEVATWLLSDGAHHLVDTAFHSELARDVVLDAEVELVLTALRKALCKDPERLDDAPMSRFVVALMRQCHLNEYVFYVSPEEEEWRAQLSEVLERGLSGANWKTVAVLALYEPLDEVASEAADGALLQEAPQVLRDYLDERRREQREEAEIAGSIETFGPLKNPTSLKVAAMYEVSPYPRWSGRLQIPVGSRCALIERYFGETAREFTTRPFDVLLAGCATGSQAIHCGLGYGPNARVLAIDLSRKSIAYAARKANEHGVTNVAFMQADILDLTNLDREFDIIESVGVLHHMADPLEGWRVLASRLRSGGLMHIGLYSAFARREITRFRDAVLTDATGLDEIRQHRRNLIMKHKPSEVWRVEDVYPFCRDFFSLSNCRDLLFHVEEHTYSIPDLQKCFGELGLVFGGFMPPPPLKNRMFYRYPADNDLDGWWAFEQQNPDTFYPLYDFWCMKTP